MCVNEIIEYKVYFHHYSLVDQGQAGHIYIFGSFVGLSTWGRNNDTYAIRHTYGMKYTHQNKHRRTYIHVLYSLSTY